MAVLDIREVGAVFIGGAVGALARALVSTLGSFDPTRWPWTTFVVNMVGSALLAYFATILQQRPSLSSYWRPLLCTGLCGGLTTFATMQVEVVQMIESGSYALAASYTIVATVCGVLLIRVVRGAVRRVPVRA